jgi:glycosyltransferase involved in cell wall biosynthesis
VGDVSLVLALHREGTLLRPTLLSLREAVQYAHAKGITTELVVTLDQSDETTRNVLREFEPDSFGERTILEVNYGSLGLARNAGIDAARGQYVSICDGDDLLSFNFLATMFQTARAAGAGHVVFPQYLYAFGDQYHCWKYFPLSRVTPLAFLETHPYTSRYFALREVFQTIRYTDVRPSSGYAYEDWHFNAECVARGLQMIVAEDVILFYRRRAGSLSFKADRKTTMQIPPCSLFGPERWVRITQRAYDCFTASGTTFLSRPASDDWRNIPDRPLHRALLKAANAIDPAVDLHKFAKSTFGSNMDGVSVQAAIAYHEICRIVGAQKFDDVFLLPFISHGGAERYIGDVMQALYELRPAARALVLLGEFLHGGSRVDRVPPNATVIDLGNGWQQLTMAQRQLITLKLIQCAAPSARLHLRPSLFTEEFYRRFKSILCSNAAVFYRFGDMTTTGQNCRSPAFKFVSEHITALDLIVADNETIIRDDRERIGIDTHKWRWLPARHAARLSGLEAMQRAATTKGRVLWASRLDREKRPDLLPHIAALLSQQSSSIHIDVYGKAVLDAFDPAIFDAFSNITYCGPFESFEAIDCASYDAFVYTSAYDGMPNVVLEAIAAGVPVVAPDVGGIGEIVVDGDSGVLVPNLRCREEMAAAYAGALTRLAADPQLRARLAANALGRLVDRHAPHAFAAAVKDIFGSQHPCDPQAGIERRVSMLEGQIASLRRAAVVDQQRFLAPKHVVPAKRLKALKRRLRDIKPWQGYRSLAYCYGIIRSPVVEPVIRYLRAAAGRALRRHRPIF